MIDPYDVARAHALFNNPRSGDLSRRNGKQGSHNFSFTWSCKSPPEYKLIGYTIQHWIKTQSSGWLSLREEDFAEVCYDGETSENILKQGMGAFLFDGRIVGYEADWNNEKHRIFSDVSIEDLVPRISHAIQWENPLRRKHVHIFNERASISARVRPVPAVSFNDVILDSKVKEDLIDNTVRHLEYINGHNGIILHGPPGTGKSMTCQAIIAEAIRSGFSTCYVVERIDFQRFEEFVERYLAPCLIVLEDLDSFAQERLSSIHSSFSDFLQFMSGLTERKEKTVVVATTNHLELLDQAITNRPVRFNRRYELNLPGERELQALLNKHFPEGALPLDAGRRCKEAGFTGSHITELRRTAQILARKSDRPAHAVFDEAFEVLCAEFAIGNTGQVGFIAPK